MKNHYKEMLLYGAILITGFLVFSELDAFEEAYIFSRLHEEWELDELFLLIPVVTICLAVFSWNRLREMRRYSKALESSRQELAAAKDKLEELTRAREEFMAVACHELKSPLSGVINALQLLEWAKDEAERKESVEYARAAARGLSMLVDDVLAYSRLSHDGDQIVKSFLCDEIFNSINMVSQPQADAKGLEFNTFVEASVPETVIGNEAGLRLVILNLVGNGIKYTESGGVSVNVDYRQEGARQELVVRVTDTGSGIPEEEQQTIFEPFRKGGQTRKGLKDGLGLGLAIVRSLVERMGGTIAVSSVVGEGTEFTVKIPVKLPS